jgi:hypothetical protein
LKGSVLNFTNLRAAIGSGIWLANTPKIIFVKQIPHESTNDLHHDDAPLFYKSLRDLLLLQGKSWRLYNTNFGKIEIIFGGSPQENQLWQQNFAVIWNA